MKAIILASGIGSRLKPLTNGVPKCLLKLNGKTILDYQLEYLAKLGIKKIIITTGHLDEKIREHMKRYPDIEVTYVRNPDYIATNYIYSLWLARNCIDDDVILLHSDLVFDFDVIKKLFDSRERDCVLVNDNIPPPEKDFKALVENGRIEKIGVKVRGKNAYFCLPLYKLSKPFFIKWLDAIGEMINQGKTKCYAEDAFNAVSNKLELKPLYFSEFGTEIDDFEDLENAKKHLKEAANKFE